MDIILVTHNNNLSNENLYDLLIQGVRDQFLNPMSKIILRLPDSTDLETNSDQITLLQKVYHNIVLEDLKRLRREIPSTTYKFDSLFDQAMYRNMLDDIIDPVTRNSYLVFIEQNVMDQMSELEYKRRPIDRHIRRKTIDGLEKSKSVEIDERKIRREIQQYRHKKIKYTNISQHPTAKNIAKLYNMSIDKISFGQLKYFFTRIAFQYNPFDKVAEIPVSIKPYDYIEAIRDLSRYHQSGSYYSSLLADSALVKTLEHTNNKRIDEFDISEDLKDFLALSYVKYRPKSFVITVWSPGFDHLSKLVDKLRKDGEVYYVREYELDYSTLDGVMFWLYNDFSYEKRTEFIQKKLEYIGATESNKIGVIVFDNINNLTIAGQGSKYKSELRNMLLDMIKSAPNYDGTEYRGNDLIHVNDFHYQTVEYSQIYFHSNTLRYIGIQDRSLYLKRTNDRANLILQTLRSYMYQNGDYRTFDRIITFGSSILYALGIRRNTDIDASIIDVANKNEDEEFINGIEQYFMNPKSKFKFADIGIPSSSYWRDRWTERNKEWFGVIKNGPKDLVDFATNPAHHIYFQGIKIGILEYDVVKKILRGEAHDVLDLIYIHYILGSKFDLSTYYDIKSDSEIAELKPLDNPITYGEHISKFAGRHGKLGATLGKTDDLTTLADLIKRTLVKRYDVNQIEKIKDTVAFKHLIPNVE